MFSKRSFGKVFCILFTFVLALFSTTLVAFQNGTFEALGVIGFIQNFLRNWTAAFLLANVMPLPSLGIKIAHKVGIKNEKSFPFQLVSCFVSAVIMVYPMAFIGLFYEMGLAPIIWKIWLTSGTIQLFIIYVFLLVAMPVCLKLTDKLCSKEVPMGPGGPGAPVPPATAK